MTLKWPTWSTDLGIIYICAISTLYPRTEENNTISIVQLHKTPHSNVIILKFLIILFLNLVNEGWRNNGAHSGALDTYLPACTASSPSQERFSTTCPRPSNCCCPLAPAGPEQGRVKFGTQAPSCRVECQMTGKVSPHPANIPVLKEAH